jgi:hypothetical protein
MDREPQALPDSPLAPTNPPIVYTSRFRSNPVPDSFYSTTTDSSVRDSIPTGQMDSPKFLPTHTAIPEQRSRLAQHVTIADDEPEQADDDDVPLYVAQQHQLRQDVIPLHRLSRDTALSMPAGTLPLHF